MTHSHGPTEGEAVAARLTAAFESGDLADFGALLDDNVRWGPETDTSETCHTRAQVLERLASQRAAGMETQVLEIVAIADAVMVGFNVKWPIRGGFAREDTVYQVLKVHHEHVIDIRGYEWHIAMCHGCAHLACHGAIRHVGPFRLVTVALVGPPTSYPLHG
jgi:ketosteroid isomerase-like protein